MGWNIAILCIQAPPTAIADIVPDVFGKTEEGIWFEDAASVRMGSALAVSYYQDWVVMVDVQGRFIKNDQFIKNISRDYPVKMFWIAEDLLYREYKEGVVTTEIAGISAAGKYLQARHIEPTDEWGETRIIQLFEHEIMKAENIAQPWNDVWMHVKFDKYELD